MSKSWNWRIAPFTEQDTAHYQRGANDEKWPQHRHYYLCRKKGCGALPEVFVRYDYVTGRQGRVSWQEKPYCRAHGEQIVAAHRQPEAA